MSFDIERMIESKKKMRRKLASRPIAEKLEMLDLLRERAVAVREAVKNQHATVVHEQQANYRTEKK